MSGGVADKPKVPVVFEKPPRRHHDIQRPARTGDREGVEIVGPSQCA